MLNQERFQAIHDTECVGLADAGGVGRDGQRQQLAAGGSAKNGKHIPLVDLQVGGALFPVSFTHIQISSRNTYPQICGECGCGAGCKTTCQPHNQLFHCAG